MSNSNLICFCCVVAHADDTHVCEALALVLTDLGTALKASGNISEALKRYQQAVHTYPSCAAGHYNLGVITSEAKQVRYIDENKGSVDDSKS